MICLNFFVVCVRSEVMFFFVIVLDDEFLEFSEVNKIIK